MKTIGTRIDEQRAARLTRERLRYEGKTRREYLRDLADNHGVEPFIVYSIADLLGPSEDFDGLVTAIEDAAAEGFDAERFC